MKALSITVLGIFIGVIASVMNQLWIVGIGALVAIWGAWSQYVESIPFGFLFTEADWGKVGDSSFYLEIPHSKHNKLNPTTTVFLGSPSNFEEIICDVRQLEKSRIRLEAGFIFSGKVVIK